MSSGLALWMTFSSSGSRSRTELIFEETSRMYGSSRTASWRSASVAKVLSDQFKIAADRFKTDGMGDTKPVADNAKAEGRAMNRRVEFTKL